MIQIENNIGKDIQFAYQKKNPPFWQNFDICEISYQAKLIEYNPREEETEYLKTIIHDICHKKLSPVSDNIGLRKYGLNELNRGIQICETTQQYINTHFLSKCQPIFLKTIKISEK